MKKTNKHKKQKESDVHLTDKGIIIEPPLKPKIPPSIPIIKSSKKPKKSSEAV